MFFLKLCAEDKACNQNQIRSKEKEFYTISFLCNYTKIFLQKSFRERTRTLNPENGASSYGWSLSQVSEHVFMQNLFLQLAKDTEYNWVLIEAIQGFRWNFSSLTFRILLDLMLKICLTCNFLSFLSSFKISRIEKFQKLKHKVKRGTIGRCLGGIIFIFQSWIFCMLPRKEVPKARSGPPRHQSR